MRDTMTSQRAALGEEGLMSGVRAAVAEQVTAWLASRGVARVALRWRVDLPSDERRSYRQDPQILVSGWIQDPDSARRRRALLEVHQALQAAQILPGPLKRIEKDDLVTGTTWGEVERIVIEISALFAVADYPLPADPAFPYGDKDLWPDAACPQCGTLADSSWSPSDPPAQWEWECDTCDHQWRTPDRLDAPERARAQAIADLAAAADARARTGAAHEAATEDVRQAALTARDLRVTTRRVVEIGQISPDTLGRWEQQRRREIAEARAALGLPDDTDDQEDDPA